MQSLAGCVIQDAHDRVLLLHRNKNGLVQWELPGGKVDDGEEAVETAVREVREELGVSVRIDRIFGEADFTHNGKTFHYSWFLATVLEGAPHVCEPETFDDARYFSVDEMSTLELSANMKNLYKHLRSELVRFDGAVA